MTHLIHPSQMLSVMHSGLPDTMNQRFRIYLTNEAGIGTVVEAVGLNAQRCMQYVCEQPLNSAISIGFLEKQNENLYSFTAQSIIRFPNIYQNNCGMNKYYINEYNKQKVDNTSADIQ